MIFAPAPWFRILFLAIAAFIIIGIFTIASDESSEGGFLVPIIIAAACIIAALYEESWIFNRKKRIILSKSGLLIINKSKQYSFEELESLQLEIFIRGGRSLSPKDNSDQTEAAENGTYRTKTVKKYCQILRLNLKSGNSLELETVEGYNTDIMKQKAWILSDFCALELLQ